jgi:hypothetical protein
MRCGGVEDMKYFLDTEFIESGPEHPIQLLSIGIVAEDGREYYAVVDLIDLNLGLADDWVFDNVIKHLDFETGKRRKTIAKEIVEFVGEQLSWIGYYADYDWVVLCQLFGRMVDLPVGWPKYCLDLKQMATECVNPRMPDLPDKIEHHALWDAREIKYRYDWLMKQYTISYIQEMEDAVGYP